MKFRTLSVLLLLASGIFAVDSDGRSAAGRRGGRQSMPFRTPAKSNVVEFDLKYDFSVPGETRMISLVVLIPKTIPGRQKIISRGYSHKPSRIFHENGNHYAEFMIREPQRHEEVKIRVKAELFPYDWLNVRTGAAEDPNGNGRPGDFLAHERYLECGDEAIRQIAEGIKGENELDVVKGIYDGVLDHMDYVINGKDDKGALKALELGKGDCTEYSDLFVALCRAKNIPARVVTGYTVRTDVATSKHNWTEVYMKDRGWVPIDPTTGDAAGNGMFRYKAIRNDRVLRNHNFGAFRYWGDEVKLTDSVEFKLPSQSTVESR
ncbi:MAG: transglutaminase-like domain-containing protein [Planctomycetota bacterium]|jgi:transglutaminase-like putative cysteine protease